MALNVSDADFEQEVINANLPVLVDFWAEWCGPCKQLTPIIDELSNEKSDLIKVVKINIDDNPETPSKLGVRGIPTLILFKNGKQLGVKVGALPKSALYEWVDSLLADA